MSNETIKITLTGDAADLVKEYQRMAEAQKKAEETVRKEGVTAKQVNAEGRKDARDAKRLIEQSMNARERANAKIKRAADLKKKGHINEKQFRAEAKRIHKEFLAETEKTNEAVRKQSTETKKMAAATKAAAEEDKRLGKVAQDAMRKVETSTERAERELRDLNAAFKAGKIDAATYDRRQRQLTATMSQGGRRFGEFRGVLSELKTGFSGLGGTLGGTGGQLGAFITKGGVAVAVIGTLTAALAKANEKNKELLRSEGEAYIDFDREIGKLLVQGGRDSSERAAVTDRILDIAEINKADEGLVAKAAVAFESAGFARPEDGELLDVYVKAAQSANATNVDPEQIIKPIAQFLEASGAGSTEENFRDVLVRGRGLFSSGKFEFGDLSQVAKIAPGLEAAGADLETTLALFASLREKLSAEVSATGLKGVVAKLQSSPGDKTRVAALESIGLKAEDVDIAGESIEEALSRLSGALKGVDEQTRNVALSKLFGLESKDAALNLMAAIESGDVDKRRNMQNDIEGFARGVSVAQSGAAAEQQLSEVRDLRVDLARRDSALTQLLLDRAKEREQKVELQQATNKFTRVGIMAGQTYENFQDWLGDGTQVTSETASDIRRAIRQSGGTFDESLYNEKYELGFDYSDARGLRQVESLDALTSMLGESVKSNRELIQATREKAAATNDATKQPTGTQRVETTSDTRPITRKPTPMAVGGAYGGGR